MECKATLETQCHEQIQGQKPRYWWRYFQIWLQRTRQHSKHKKQKVLKLNENYNRLTENTKANQQEINKLNSYIKDRLKTKNIPNFNKDMFFEISGIDVDKDWKDKNKTRRC